MPSYKPRGARARVIDPCLRVAAYPELTVIWLLREIREIRPPPSPDFELRFETRAGRQAQVDFAHFEVEFYDAPGEQRILWLFAMVLGHSRYLWAR